MVRLTLIALVALSFHFARAEPAILRISLESNPASFDWQAYRFHADRFFAAFLMRGMFKYDSKQKVICDLCSKFEADSTGTRYEFSLKTDVLWTDEVPLSSKHFKDGLERLLRQNFPLTKRFKAIIKTVEAPTSERLVITLKRPEQNLPHLLSLTATYPIRKEFAKNSKRDFGVEMASNAVLGPYLLAAWEKGKRIVIEGNPSFKGERPVYRIEFLGGGYSQQLKLFRAGRLDVLTSPKTDDLLGTNGTMRMSPFWASRVLIPNVTRGPLVDKNLRRLILKALNTKEIPSLLRNGERSSNGIIPPGIEGHQSATSEKKPATAPKKKTSVQLLVRKNDSEVAIAKWIQTKLAQANLSVTLRKKSSNAFFDSLEKGEFEFALLTKAFESGSPMEILQMFLTNAPNNYGGWTNVAYDSVLEQVRRNPNAQSRERNIREILRLLESQEVGVIPVSYPSQPALLGRRVSNFAMTPFGEPDLLRIKLR